MPKTQSGRFIRGGKRYEQNTPVFIVFLGSKEELLYWTDVVQQLRDFYLQKKDIEILVEAAWCHNPDQAISYIRARRVDIVVSRIYFSNQCHRTAPAGILGMITDAIASPKQVKPPRILLYDQLADSIADELERYFDHVQEEGAFITLFNSLNAEDKVCLVRDLTASVAACLDPLFHYAGEV